MNSKRIIFKEGILNLIALFAALCIEFINTLLRTKAFSVDEVGLFNVIVSVTTILSTVTLFGATSILVRFIPGFQQNKLQESTGLLVYQVIKNLLVSVLLILGLYLFKDWFIAKIIKNDALAICFYVVPLYIINMNLTQILSSYLRGWYKSSSQSFIGNTLLKSINFVIILLSLKFKQNIIQYIHYYLLLMVLINLALLFSAFRHRLLCKINWRQAFADYLSKHKFVEVEVYGLVMSVSAIAAVLAANLDRIIINGFTDNAQVAIYSVAAVIGNVIGIFGTALAMIAHPLMGKYIKANDLSELESIYKFTQKWSLISTIPVAVVFIVYSNRLLSLLDLISHQQGKYSSGSLVLAIIVLGQLINVGTGMCGGIISYSKYYMMDMYTQIVLVVISTAFNFAFIPVYGIDGAAVASAVSLAIYNIIKVIYVKQKFTILPFDRSIVKVLLGSVLCLGITLAFNKLVNFPGYYLLAELVLVTIINYLLIALSGLSKGDIGRLKLFLARK